MMKPEQQQMMLAIQAAISGAKQGSFQLPDGETMTIEPSDEPGVKAVLRGAREGGVVGTIYESAAYPPNGYPNWFPFLPDVMSTVGSEVGDVRFATWFGLKDHKAAFTKLANESAADGWVPAVAGEEAGQAAAMGMQVAEFRRGDFLRTIMSAGFGPIGFAWIADKQEGGGERG